MPTSEYPLPGNTLYIDGSQYGVASGMNPHNWLLTDNGAFLLLLIKIADKEGAVVKYTRRTVRGVDAWVPVGIKAMRWDTNAQFKEDWMQFATAVGYMAAFVALAPAIGYGLAFASVGMFADAAVALVPVGEKVATSYVTNYFD